MPYEGERCRSQENCCTCVTENNVFKGRLQMEEEKDEKKKRGKEKENKKDKRMKGKRNKRRRVNRVRVKWYRVTNICTVLCRLYTL